MIALIDITSDTSMEVLYLKNLPVLVISVEISFALVTVLVDIPVNVVESPLVVMTA